MHVLGIQLHGSVSFTCPRGFLQRFHWQKACTAHGNKKLFGQNQGEYRYQVCARPLEGEKEEDGEIWV